MNRLRMLYVWRIIIKKQSNSMSAGLCYALSVCCLQLFVSFAVASNGFSENILYTYEAALRYSCILVCVGSISMCVMGLLFHVLFRRHDHFAQLSLLKLSGASNKDVVSFIAIKELLVFAMAVLPGMIAAYCIIEVLHDVFSLIGQEFQISFLFSAIVPVVVVLALFLILLLWLTVKNELCYAPLEQRTKKNEDLTPQKELRRKHPILLRSFAVRKREKNQRKLFFYSVCLCVFLFLSGLIVSTRLQKDLTQRYDFDYIVNAFDGMFFSSLGIPINPSAGVSLEQAETVLSCEELNASYALATLPLNLIIDDGRFSGNCLSDEGQYDRETVLSDLALYGYNANTRLLPSALNGITDTVIEQLAPYVKQGAIDHNALTDGTAVIYICHNEMICDFSVGDMITFTQVFANETNQYARFDWTVTVCAIVDISNAQGDIALLSRYLQPFVWNFDSFSILPTDVQYSNLFLQLYADNAHNMADYLLKQLYNDNEMVQITSAIGENVLVTALTALTRIVFGIFSGFFILLGLLYLQTMIRHHTVEQKRLWGALRSVGFGFFSAVRSELYQFIPISTGAVLCGIILAYPVNIIMNRISYASTFPHTVAVFLFIFLLLILLVLIILPLGEIYRRPIVDLLQDK